MFYLSLHVVQFFFQNKKVIFVRIRLLVNRNFVQLIVTPSVDVSHNLKELYRLLKFTNTYFVEKEEPNHYRSSPT